MKPARTHLYTVVVGVQAHNCTNLIPQATWYGVVFQDSASTTFPSGRSVVLRLQLSVQSKTLIDVLGCWRQLDGDNNKKRAVSPGEG
ncbi:hypothetical protein EYF80_023224 [Liparis tanakae]|uniref:Uncharacterized protein n=1 Tax=Liparis tanakae TaxID=230148 RepID=A0A4Z2HL18_9TELE|nr:hypothetical protein EYF80_023224 [Liparis tanakae]